MPPSAPPSSLALASPQQLVIEPRQLGRMVGRMRLREDATEFAQAGTFGRELTAENVRMIWGIGHLGTPETKRTFERCRQLYKTNDWVGWLVDTLVLFCNDGLSLGNSEPLKKWHRERKYNFAKLAKDVFLEFILNNSAILFWRQPDAQVLPIVQVMDCEDCSLLNAFGHDLLTIKPKTVALTKEQEDELGERYAKALKGGELKVKNGEQGEFYRYITEEKNGAGMGLPRLYQVFQDLSLRDLLKTGDWNGGWMLKNVIRLVRRGHEIKNGPLAGQDIHFLRGKEAKKIKHGLETNVGAFDMVTNFDVTVTYSHLDPKYLDPAKFKGVDARLRAWAGPLGRVLDSRQGDADTMKWLEVQCLALRASVGPLLDEMLASPEFHGEVAPPEAVQVTWSQTTFINFKLLMERVRLAQSAGISSTRTGRENLGYDHALESARLKAEHNDPESVTPAFEQKQGMVNKGGRPPEKENKPLPE